MNIKTIINYLETLKDLDSVVENLREVHNTTIQTCCHYLNEQEVVSVKHSDRGEDAILDCDAASFYAGYSMALGDVIDFLSKNNSDFNYPFATKKNGVRVFPIYNLIKNRLNPT